MKTKYLMQIFGILYSFKIKDEFKYNVQKKLTLFRVYKRYNS